MQGVLIGSISMTLNIKFGTAYGCDGAYYDSGTSTYSNSFD